MTDENTEDIDKQERTHLGVELKGKIKRGTGTRDQDQLIIKAKGADAQEATEEFEAVLETIEEGHWNDRLRRLQTLPDTEEKVDE